MRYDTLMLKGLTMIIIDRDMLKQKGLVTGSLVLDTQRPDTAFFSFVPAKEEPLPSFQRA